MSNRLILLFIFTTFQISLFSQEPWPDLVPYKKGDVWGYSNLEGTIQIQPEYDKVEFFVRSHAFVWEGKKLGMINKDGKKLLIPVYDKIHVLDKNNIKVIKDGKVGLLNWDEQEIMKIKYDDITYLEQNYMKAALNGKFGVFHTKDGKAKRIIPVYYDRISRSYDKNMKVIFICSLDGQPNISFDAEGNSLGVVDDENYLIEEEMDIAFEDNTPLYPNNKRKSTYSYQLINDGDKEGMITQSDTIPAIYDYIDPRYDFGDTYVVKKDNKWGVINKKNEVYVNIEYDSIDMDRLNFQNIWGGEYKQVIIVKQGAFWGMIGNKNKFRVTGGGENDLLIPIEFTSIQRNVNHKFFILEKDGLYGIVTNGDFSISVEPKYRKIEKTYHVVNGKFIYKVVNQKGEKVFVGQNGVEYFED